MKSTNDSPLPASRQRRWVQVLQIAILLAMALTIWTYYLIKADFAVVNDP